MEVAVLDFTVYSEISENMNHEKEKTNIRLVEIKTTNLASQPR